MVKINLKKQNNIINPPVESAIITVETLSNDWFDGVKEKNLFIVLGGFF